MIQSVDRALKILDYLKINPKGSGVTEVATHLQIAKSSAHRLLATLVEHNYVQQNDNQNYVLGLKFIEMNNYVISNLDILGSAHPLIEQLCDDVDEIVHLVQLRDFEVVYIDKVENSQSIRIYSQIGRTAPLYCTGVGKVILAYKDSLFIENYLSYQKEFKVFTPYTVKDKQELLDRINRIKDSGYGFDDQEHELNIRCVSAPIFNHEHQVNHAISVTGPIHRMTDEKIQQIIPKLLKCTQEISKSWGYVPKKF